ncbi:MAG TPA: hypothetical protein VHC01_03295 [Gaiellaceae bacterium]|nr:hypothetical protein [Gaiellaceae bacterium]
MRLALVSCAVTVAAALSAATASASQLIDRNAKNVDLAVDGKGEALVTYTDGGTVRHVLAWGAVDAEPPKRGGKQVEFKLDYAGGFGKYGNPKYWTTFAGGCAAYDGPKIPFEVAACKAGDGSYWALQAWQRGLPDYGVRPTPAQSAVELRLSHWTGALPVLSIAVDWAYRRYDHLYGTYTYGGIGVYGFRSTSAGQPLDAFGRNVYVDTFDSAYGKGWKRENSFLTHGPKGSFCYGFYAHGSHPSGKGTEYRAYAEGPGVAPDVSWQGRAPGPYDRAADALANDAIRALGDPKCKAS